MPWALRPSPPLIRDERAPITLKEAWNLPARSSLLYSSTSFPAILTARISLARVAAGCGPTSTTPVPRHRTQSGSIPEVQRVQGSASESSQVPTASILVFFVESSRIIASMSSIAAVTYALTALGLLVLTGELSIISRACFSKPRRPGLSIVNPCHRTAATMQVKRESLSLIFGYPKCSSRSRR